MVQCYLFFSLSKERLGLWFRFSIDDKDVNPIKSIYPINKYLDKSEVSSVLNVWTLKKVLEKLRNDAKSGSCMEW